jgi:hypoxanthine phosphoribosyltransferase
MSSQPEPAVLITRQDIAAAVRRLAAAIKQDYQGKNPLLLGVLKGSFVFLADLMRCLSFPLEIDFIRLSSYQGTVSSGKIKVVCKLNTVVKGRDVLVVEDIVDTGLTTSFLFKYLLRRQASSVRLCALLDKPSRRESPVTIDYLGLTVPDRFLVGYGLDCAEQYRYLPDICYIEDKS